MNHTSVGRDGVRFIFAGLLNTGLTFLVYQLLLFVAGRQLAYAISWCVGLLFVIVVYPSKVFVGGRTDARARLGLGVTYLLVFVIGLASLEGLAWFGVSARISIIFVMAATTAANFVLGRILVRHNSAGAS